MSTITKRLPQSELEIMQIVWNTDAKKDNQIITSSFVLTNLQGKRNWALPTLMTVLARLIKKGYLVCDKIGRNNIYHPAVSKEDYMKFEAKLIFEDTFEGSANSMFKALIDTGVTTKEELAKEIENL